MDTQLIHDHENLVRMFEQAPTFMALLQGAQHRFEFVNPAYLRLVGHRPVLGKTVAEALPEAAAQGYLELLDRVYATGEAFSATGARLDVQLEANGPLDERYLDFVYQPIRDATEQVTGVFVQGFDVTQRVAAELALRHTKEQLRTLNSGLEQQMAERSHERGQFWQFTSDLLGLLNSEGYFERSNDAWQTVLGWSEEEVQSTSIFELLHPDDRENTREGFERLKGGTPALNFVNRYRCKDGSYRWLSWVGVPEEGKYYCSGRDITAQHEARILLDETREALRHSQKMEAVGKLTGGVAHDFNNLLTVIQGSVELLRRFPDLPIEKRSRYVEVIADTVTRAAKLTGQLLAFARRQTLKPEVLDVSSSVRALGQMLSTLVGPDVNLTQDLAATNCFVHSDAIQFDTALLNLVVNAADATQSQGTLTITARSVSCVPALRQNPLVTGEYVEVTVIDQGVGIPASNLDQIFEPFFTTKKIGQGTGLGLSQVFGFVKQSGGEIRVDSEVGRGSAFSIYLPRVPAPEQKATHQEGVVRGVQEGAGIRVLVVEDNDAVGTFTRQSLTDRGFEATLAVDGVTALDALQRDPQGFDVVFSDVVMPGMTGIELGQAIRVQYPGLPVILTSGYSPALATSGSQGFELIDKPYSIEAVMRLLTGAARQRSAF